MPVSPLAFVCQLHVVSAGEGSVGWVRDTYAGGRHVGMDEHSCAISGTATPTPATAAAAAAAATAADTATACAGVDGAVQHPGTLVAPPVSFQPGDVVGCCITVPPPSPGTDAGTDTGTGTGVRVVTARFAVNNTWTGAAATMAVTGPDVCVLPALSVAGGFRARLVLGQPRWVRYAAPDGHKTVWEWIQVGAVWV